MIISPLVNFVPLFCASILCQGDLMIRRDQALELCQKILSHSPTKDIEVVLQDHQQALTRYANGSIVQNLDRHTLTATARLLQDDRECSVEFQQFDDDSIQHNLQKALSILNVSPPLKHPIPLVENQQYHSVDALSPNSTQQSPQERADAVNYALETCARKELQTAGRYELNLVTDCYANSNDLFTIHHSSDTIFSSTIATPDNRSEGWALSAHRDCQQVDTQKTVDKALEIALNGQHAEDIPPAKYTVILSPAAVAELILFMGRMSFSGLSLLEKRTYHADKIGQKFFSDSLSIRDDPFDKRLPGRPWDLEGTASKPVSLIHNGIAKGCVWDRKSSLQARLSQPDQNQQSTGHSLKQPNITGPRPRNVIMEGTPGRSLEQLIQAVDSGLLVHRFHYCNVVNPMELSITGMTRSGLFKIQNGQISKPVKNFRFTISLLDIFNKITDSSDAVRAEGALFGERFVVPALRIEEFQMTSSTDF